MESNRRPDINSQTYEHLIFDKGDKSMQWKKESIFNKWCWHNWMSACRRMKIDHIYHHAQNSSPNGLNSNLTTLNQIEEKVGSSLQHMGIGDHFLHITPVAQSIRATLNKWDLLKQRSFCKAKDTVIKTKRHPTEWEKIFTNPHIRQMTDLQKISRSKELK